MTSKAAILALLTLWGVGAGLPYPALAEEAASSSAPSGREDEDRPDLTNRVWVKTGGPQPISPASSRYSSPMARWCRIRAGKPTASRPGR